MTAFLAALAASHLIVGLASLGVAMLLLVALALVATHAGMYYALPKTALKWLCRRALAAA